VAELAHETLHHRSRLGNQPDRGVVGGGRHGKEDVEAVEDGPASRSSIAARFESTALR
jgi:hypothetical protein